MVHGVGVRIVEELQARQLRGGSRCLCFRSRSCARAVIAGIDAAVAIEGEMTNKLVRVNRPGWNLRILRDTRGGLEKNSGVLRTWDPDWRDVEFEYSSVRHPRRQWAGTPATSSLGI